MTEQGMATSVDKRLEMLRCGVLFLTDASQALRAIMLKDFGWTDEIVNLVDKANVIEAIVRAVIPFNESFVAILPSCITEF